MDLIEKSLAKRWERFKQVLDPDSPANFLRSLKTFQKKEFPGQRKEVFRKDGSWKTKHAIHAVKDAINLGMIYPPKHFAGRQRRVNEGDIINFDKFRKKNIPIKHTPSKTKVPINVEQNPSRAKRVLANRFDVKGDEGDERQVFSSQTTAKHYHKALASRVIGNKYRKDNDNNLKETPHSDDELKAAINKHFHATDRKQKEAKTWTGHARADIANKDIGNSEASIKKASMYHSQAKRHLQAHHTAQKMLAKRKGIGHQLLGRKGWHVPDHMDSEHQDKVEVKDFHAKNPDLHHLVGTQVHSIYHHDTIQAGHTPMAKHEFVRHWDRHNLKEANDEEQLKAKIKHHGDMVMHHMDSWHGVIDRRGTRRPDGKSADVDVGALPEMNKHAHRFARHEKAYKIAQNLLSKKQGKGPLHRAFGSYYHPPGGYGHDSQDYKNAVGSFHKVNTDLHHLKGTQAYPIYRHEAKHGAMPEHEFAKHWDSHSPLHQRLSKTFKPK